MEIGGDRLNGIKKHRLAAGLTQQMLADEIHRAKSCVCLYEKGTRTPPVSIAKRIASVVGCSLDDLFKEE